MLKPLAARTAATRGSGTDHDNVAWTPNDQGGDGTNKARSAGHCQLPSFVLSGILTVVRPTIKGCEGRSRAAFFWSRYDSGGRSLERRHYICRPGHEGRRGHRQLVRHVLHIRRGQGVRHHDDGPTCR